ncbi:hypothetical protein QYH69_23725 [Paraburkholderia sp. SARCC-3016]|uniref:hypothetical protein n=1 Tax=Paraburkholderia sp. SARCC-3016 TaxID=3058611 RepID=UPI002807998D|nr:hypothetical protein [Paraburkholderia sp. SARCC-3016]MDQ7980257.1 hypothetical protein [Paraburkholderia sp. SARCC-3016]
MRSLRERVLWASAVLDTNSRVQDLLDAVTVLRPDNDEARVALAWWHVPLRVWGAALSELRLVGATMAR